MRIILFLILSTAFINIQLTAQDEKSAGTNEGRGILVDINYGYAFPFGDMKDRFGRSFDVGGGVEMITGGSNWIFGLSGGILFGNTVKEDVLVNLRTPEGAIIGSNAAWADVQLKERGFHAEARFGKLIPLMEDNKRSGLRLVMGLGLLQHKIRLQEDPSSFVPQILDNYAKGYDRLSNGLMISEFIAYQHLSKNKLINFYAGFELTQAFTQNRRNWDFATKMSSDTSTRTDLLIGVKAGWILPFYISAKHAEGIRY